jgi:hypothetical protein
VKASGIPEEATELNSPNGVVRFAPESGQTGRCVAKSALCH